MERNAIKMIDLTQFMFMESTGDSDAKSDLDTGSYSRCHQRFLAEFNDDDDDDENNKNDDDDDAESCSYGSSHSGYADDFSHDYRDKKNVHQHDDDDDDHGMSYHDDDQDDGEDDAVDSKMVEVSKKCGAWEDKRDCSKTTRFSNEKENDKNFWETCLAS